MDVVAMREWCPDAGETDPGERNLTEDLPVDRAAEETAVRVWLTSNVDYDVNFDHVVDDKETFHVFHVEVDTSPRFEAFSIGP